MFYSVELLSAHHGKFGLIWLAATHMRKTLTRRELNSVDIVDACNEVMSSILGRVKIRMSLYLASQLTFGLCIIYREKTKSVLRDLQELYSRSGFTFHPQSIDLPVSGSARRSKKRVREEASADMPEVAVRDQLVDLIGFGDLQMPELAATPYVNPDIELMETQNSLYQARAEDITLVEENLTTTTGAEMTFGEDLQPVSLDLLQNIEVFQSGSKKEISEAVPHPPVSADLVDLDRLEEEIVSVKPGGPSPKQADSEELIKDEKLGQEQAVVIHEAQLIQETPMASQENRSVLPTEGGLPKQAEDQNQPGVSIETVIQKAERIEQQTFQTLGDEEPASSAVKEPAQEVKKVVQTESTVVLAPDEGADETRNARIAQQPEQESSLLGQHQSQHPLENANPYVMPALEVEPLQPARPITARRGRHATRSKLIIDSKTRLSIDELRYNMEHGEETMVLHDTLLAEPSSRTRTRYLLSRCVPRLLALPASIETALSARLCDVWCRHRRWCEDMLTASLTVDHLVPSDGGGDRPTGSTSVHLSRVNEEGETSIEQMRAAQNTPSFPQSSLLGTTGTMDLTVNQSTKHTSLLESTVSSRLRTVDHPAVAPPMEPESVPPPPASMATTAPELTLTDTTRPQPEPPAPEPVPEEQKSDQIEPKSDTAQPQPVLLELPAESIPPAVQFTYTSRDDVWKQVQAALSAGATEIEIHELCPLGMSKKDASLVFSSLLELAKRRRVVLSQSEPFSAITITLP